MPAWISIIITKRTIATAKVALFSLCLMPALLLALRGWNGDLGANPIEMLARETGDWALRMLIATLAVTPLRRLTGWKVVARFRRMLGVYSFFYATLHVATYVVLDQFFAWGEILADLLDRPYILFGATTFALLTPLAVTSTHGWQRRLGRRWQRLHRLVYPAAGLALLHFFWLVKADIREPLIYIGIVVLLFGSRLWYVWRKRAAGIVLNLD